MKEWTRPLPPEPKPKLEPYFSSRRPLDWRNEQQRALWLGQVRLAMDDLLQVAATAASGCSETWGLPSTLRARVQTLGETLRQLLAAAGAYPKVAPAPERRRRRR